MGAAAVQAVLFDFDYTLADSSPGVVDCIQFAFHRMGLPRAPANRIRRTIGLSVPETLVDLAGERLRCRSDEFRRLFRERADQVMAANTAVFDTAAPALEWLREQGVKTGIVSTKFRYRIESILAREGLSEMVDVIVGGEDVEREKPDPAGLSAAVERLEVAPAAALYVGDSLTDAETARRAGVRFVAVLTGTTEAGAFADQAVEELLRTLDELPGLVERLSSSGLPAGNRRPGVGE